MHDVPHATRRDRRWKKGAFGIVYRPDGSIGRTVRTERYRYNEWSTPDEAELYDHRNDPHEYVDLADGDAQADTVAEMRKLLKSGWQAAGPSATASNIENEPRTK